MTDETKPTKEETLAELKRKVQELENQLETKDGEIDKLKKKEEGYLVWTPNAQYDGVTAGVTFTNGMAFIQKDRVYPGYGNAEKMANYLKNDFGYQMQYFSKDEMDKLQERLSQRAKERAEVQAKIGTPAEMLEKLMQVHHL